MSFNIPRVSRPAYKARRKFAIILPLVLLSVAAIAFLPRLFRLNEEILPQSLIAIRGSDLSSLVVYDEPDREGSELMSARYVANLLGHFGIKPEIVHARDYSAGQADKYSALFVVSSAHYGPLPKVLVQDVAASRKPVCWLNRGIEQLLAESGVTEKLGFRFDRHVELPGEVSVIFKGKSLPKVEGLINVVTINDASKAEVLAVARNKSFSTPYAIKAGNFWYFADLVFSYSVDADRSLVLCETLHDILGQEHKNERYALVRIEDVNPESNPDQLRAVADVMASRGIPFQVSLIPIFKSAARRVDIYLSDRPLVVDALKYMVSRGGTIILHGVTHQLRGDTSDDFEFWDTLTGKPSHDSSKAAVMQKLELGLDECFRAGLFPIAWETPHYAASMAHYSSLKSFFSHAYDRRPVSDDRETAQALPYEVEDIYGQFIIPENLGYVNIDKPEPSAIVDAAGRMLCVRDSIPSFFFHPFMSVSYLKTALDGIQNHGFRFISAENFGCSVSVGSYAVSTIPKSLAIEAIQPYFRRVVLSTNGRAVESFKKVAQEKVIQEKLVPPPGGLVAIQSVPRVPKAKPGPTMVDRIKAWWNETDIESIPVPQQIARRALLVVNPLDETGSHAFDVRSFESFLRVYGIRFEKVNAANLKDQNLGEDCVVFVPRSVSDEITYAGAEKLTAWLHDGGRLVLEGRTDLAERFGFSYETRKMSVASTRDILFPGIEINWQRVAQMDRYDPPPVSTALVIDANSEKPVAVASRYGEGLVLYLGTELDPDTGMGYTRYPYLFHHLRNRMRLFSPVTAHGVEFYFDPGYREEAPLEKLVSSWHADGIRAVYAAAWHFYPNWQYDYDTLIRMCHERGIAVYAWFEFPQVSDILWTKHPEWREKTVSGRDGQVGWRKQMNFANAECRAAALAFFSGLLQRHDWDGVNIAELSFDTRDGLLVPELYVPMNNEVRQAFQKYGGFDPILLFDKKSSLYWQKNRTALAKWEKYRTQLLNDWLVEFLDRVEKIRLKRPLDCIVTSLDSLHTPRIVEKTGTDTRDIVALMDRYDFTLQVEDPIEMWGASPDRYRRFAETYSELVQDPRRLMFDINVVTDRENGLAPTRLPAGTELALTVFSAAQAGNGRVAIYSEASLQPEDRTLLPFVLGSAANLSVDPHLANKSQAGELTGAGAARIAVQRTVRLSLVNESGKDTLYLGPAGDSFQSSYKMEREKGSMVLLNDEPWQCGREGEVLVPAGEHTLSTAKIERTLADRFGLGLWVKDITAEVGAVSRTPLGIAINYESPRRVWAVLTREPKAVYIDSDKSREFYGTKYRTEYLVQLPAGRHKVEINDATTASVVVDMASAVSSRSVVWLGGKFVLILVILYAAVRARRLILVLGTKLR